MYLALYRKWRPKTFDDVISQEPITTTLRREVAQGSTAHAYLFTGPRGTGKTTCAKILAKAVNCPHTADGNPCMECEICRGIDDGSILDVMEIDAASNNGVDDVRLLREEANYLPTQCRCRVYIIDEAHMLSTAAFNALLKIMEEPPEHVKFILATTEVHKVPATILSRCQRFDFGRIKTEDIARRLLFVAGEEGFSLTGDAAHLLARMADGGMRDALSLLDQCIAFSDTVDAQVVAAATGLVPRDYLFRLAELIAAGKPEPVLACVDELYRSSKDLQKLVEELIGHYRSLMIARTVEDCGGLVDCMPEELDRLREQAGQLSLGTILNALSVLQECLDRMGRNYGKRLSVEMALVKLCAPELQETGRGLEERIRRLEEAVLSGKAVPARPAGEPAPPSAPAERPNEPPRPQKERPAPQPEETPAAEAPAAAEGPQAFPLWPQVLQQVAAANPALAGLLNGSQAYEAGDVLLIDSPVTLFGQMIRQEGFVKTLASVLEQQTGKSYRLRVKKARKDQGTQRGPLDELVQSAQQMGIEVRES